MNNKLIKCVSLKKFKTSLDGCNFLDIKVGDVLNIPYTRYFKLMKKKKVTLFLDEVHGKKQPKKD